MLTKSDWNTFYDARDIVQRLEGNLCGTYKGVYPRVIEHCKHATYRNTRFIVETKNCASLLNES